MTTRKLCPKCNQYPVAVNYIRNEKTYYRGLCGYCSKKGKKVKHQPPQWYRSGYRKKPQCDRCGFKAELPADQLLVYHVDGNLHNNDRCGFKAEADAQLLVYHVDGDLNNNDRLNLKTVCLNCRPMITKSRLPWKPAEVVPDF